MLPHRNSWTSLDGKTYNQIDHTLINRRWHSSILDVQSFSGADCGTDRCLVVATVRERWAVIEQAAQKFYGERFNVRKRNELGVWKQCQIEITYRLAALENLKLEDISGSKRRDI
jgi:hypothetical protein